MAVWADGGWLRRAGSCMMGTGLLDHYFTDRFYRSDWVRNSWVLESTDRGAYPRRRLLVPLLSSARRARGQWQQDALRGFSPWRRSPSLSLFPSLGLHSTPDTHGRVCKECGWEGGDDPGHAQCNGTELLSCHGAVNWACETSEQRHLRGVRWRCTGHITTQHHLGNGRNFL